MDLGSEPRALARRLFGHESLHPGQQEAIEARLGDRDVLLVAATGFGKSLVYQVTGLLSGGLTLVISPLLALQQDQLGELPGRPEVRRARLSSLESAARHTEVLEQARRGELAFLALSPEQLADDD